MLRDRLRTAILAGAFALMFGAGFGTHAWLMPAIAPAAPAPAAESRYAGFDIFWQAWDLVQRDYVLPDATKPQAMTYGAIEGMLASLGDVGHTRFLSPTARKHWDEGLAGNYVGIGIQVSLRDGRPVVVAPIAGSPAAAAGILAGDTLLKVAGTDTAGLTLDQLGGLLRGPVGSKVTITLRHAGGAAPTTLEVERRMIDVPSVAWAMLPGETVALVRINQFSDRTHNELLDALTAARAAGARGLVLDLRDDPGGLLEEAVKSAGEFLTGGVIVQVQTRDGTRTPEYDRDATSGAVTDLPLAVLINQGSASAAEIVAGALKENGRAPLFGEPTFGTGTVLSTYALSDGSAILLGTSLWLTPRGNLIKGQGIAPTTVVSLPANATPLLPAEVASLTPAALRASQDSQLLRALDDVKAREK